MYKMWAQFQQNGTVITVPFVLHVGAAEQPKPAGAIPPNAMRIQVSQHGYAPARLEIPANKAMTLAFIRDMSPSCGAEIVFPALGIRKAIAPGSTVLIELPAQKAGDISFSCGMGMFRGMVIAR
jgi:plastocyanin domain-containing protein